MIKIHNLKIITFNKIIIIIILNKNQMVRKLHNLINNNFVVTDRDDCYFRVYSLSDHLYQVNNKRMVKILAFLRLTVIPK